MENVNSYIRYGEDVNKKNNLILSNNLENKVYSLQILDKATKEKLSKENNSPVQDFYLEFKSNTINLPAKIYGKVNRLLEHYMRRFDSNNESLEVLLVGDAGSGKTLLSDMICHACLIRGMPVIDVSGLDLYGEDFAGFFKNFNNVCVRLDEFGKMISKYNQDQLLTLLTERNRRIFWILTENSYDYINNFIIGATHRVRYSQEFTKIDPEVVIGYCDDIGVDEEFKRHLLNLQNKATHFSFTHLQTLVEEHLLFPELGLNDLIVVLNLKHLTTMYRAKLISVKVCGIEIMDSKELSKECKVKLFSGRIKGREEDKKYGSFKSVKTNVKIENKNQEFAGNYQEFVDIFKDIYPMTLEIKIPILEKIPKNVLLREEIGKGDPMSYPEEFLKFIEAITSEYDGCPSLEELKKTLEDKYKEILNIKSSRENPLVFKNDYIEAEVVVTCEDDGEVLDPSYFK